MVLFILAYYSFDEAPNTYIRYILQCQKGTQSNVSERKIYLLSDSDDLTGADLFILFSIKKKSWTKLTFLE